MERKLIILAAGLILSGIVLFSLGSISLFEGLIFNHYGDHLRYFALAYSANLLMEFWGIGLLISGVIAGIYASGAFRAGKAGRVAFLVVGVTAIIVGASLSGVIIQGSFPPSEKVSVLEFGTSSNIYEINATPPTVNFSVYSLYTANISINYTYSGRVIASAENSFSGYYNSSATPPAVNFSGILSVALTVWSEGLRDSRNTNITIVPQLNVLNISGPQEINDSAAPVVAMYRPVFTGGIAPFNFSWSIGAFYVGNIQNLTTSSPYGAIFNVTYFENSINGYSYGYNVSVDITLTITDSVGMVSSYQNDSALFSSYYVVNVIGD